MITTTTVTSWQDALEALYQGSWNAGIKRFRSPYVFRGLDNSSYPLSTSLQRLGANKPSWIPRLELHLLRNFQKYAHRDVVERNSDWHWLAVAQHHGLATRLLDWTYSPFVALHFSTANQREFASDGVIWMVDIWQVQQELPAQLLKALSDIETFSFNVNMLAANIASLEQLVHFPGQKTTDGFILFFEPPSIDDRIVNQYALFSVHSDPTSLVHDWLAQRPNAVKKIVIPAGIKWEIRDKLDQSNLNERVIFPGLDGLSKWLNRNYYPIP